MRATPIIKFRKNHRGEKNAGNEDKRDISIFSSLSLSLSLTRARSSAWYIARLAGANEKADKNTDEATH